MTLIYEWDIETCFVNEDGETEILDHDHRDSIREWPSERLLQAINQDVVDDSGQFTRLVLVRDSYKFGQLDCRSWAYVEDGKLPEVFKDAYDVTTGKVPKRLVEEFAL